MPKSIAIIGITGNQGSSVASHYLSLNSAAIQSGDAPPYTIRGLTRNPASPAAIHLKSQSVEIVKADLDDASALISALKGANLIFSVTNYWEPFFRPDCRAKAKQLGLSPRKYAYDVEHAQGQNIADAAAATVDSLDDNGFIVSTLSHATQCSNGKYPELYHFDAKADIFPNYVKAKHPELAKKMSCLQTGYFMHSFRIAPASYFRRTGDKSFETCFTTHPDTKVPHLDPVGDVGKMVHAISQLPAGKSYMAAGDMMSWKEWMEVWGRVTGMESRYRQVSVEETVAHCGDEDFGKEIADMFSYSSWPGYDGVSEIEAKEGEQDAEKVVIYSKDLKKLGVDVKMTSWEEYVKKSDWSEVLNKEVVQP
ncbi:hypothetical protein H2198_010187 [Neophaeococcomyces mojaviensis]|uniref:Uncharacterized protein n=1 Tax=Neophaeococcomyces mojaviensis TaxID=3383035 RepID=A0ACC2ZSC5_9EURO|nr:hypothetical protein H2198_010187 [Knufia sp. JES_112]